MENVAVDEPENALKDQSTFHHIGRRFQNEITQNIGNGIDLVGVSRMGLGVGYREFGEFG